MTYETITLPGGATLTGYIPAPTVAGDDHRIGLVICPGGGYTHLSPREGELMALRYASLGVSCFVLSYHLDPHRYPTQLCDAAQAVAYVRSHAESFHIQPDRIAIMGFSAGGHVAGSLGVWWQNEELMAQAGVTPEQARPNAMVLCYPVITAGEKAHRGSFIALTGSEDVTDHLPYSLEEHVSPATPPTFLWHTWQDGAVPVENTLYMAQALKASGVQAEVHIYPFGGHGLAMANETTAVPGYDGQIIPEVQGWLEDAFRFLTQVM
ncbi:MAG: alpha/beta hydrolase [Clostridiales bacterium]|nr:alpha/beta hydrolase [Clostridiales bacterium]